MSENFRYVMIHLLTQSSGEIVDYVVVSRDFLGVASVGSDTVQDRSALLPHEKAALSEEIALAASIGSYPVPVEGDAFPELQILCEEAVPPCRYAEIVTAGASVMKSYLKDLLPALRTKDFGSCQCH